MAKDGWEFWLVTRSVDGEFVWMAVTRPGARALIDRKKVWTLVPGASAFIANWFVTEDYLREDGAGLWEFENIDSYEAREIVLETPQPSAEDLTRLTRPESTLTLDQIDRHHVSKLLGTRVADQLAARMRNSR